jgi:Zn-dependent protease with chaperone function
MDFFAAQDRARKRTKYLVVLLGVAVLVISGLLFALFFVILSSSEEPTYINYEHFLFVLAGVVAIIGGGSLIKLMGLRAGGAAVAEMIGGELIPRETSDSKQRMLLNIVDEMAIASGVPVPPCYIIPGESGINAFAAGYRTDDAVVAVTSGALEQFDRDELQGVMAHEFSHVLNGDMRLNIRLIAVIAGLLGIAIIGRVLLRSASHTRRRRSKDGDGRAAILAIGLALTIIGYAGVFFGRLIQAAVSRQREMLADASAVQFTRNPQGIRNALIRIGGFTEGSYVDQPGAEEISHSLFAQGFKHSFFSGMFATHPPIEARIEALGGVRLNDDGLAPTRRADQVMDRIGQVAGFGGTTAGAPPTPIDSPLDAAGLACALLLDWPGPVRDRQQQSLSAWPLLARAASSHAESVSSLPLDQRLATLDQAAPELRRLSSNQAERLLQTVLELARADDHLNPFEIAIAVVLERRLQRALNRHRPKLERLSNESTIVLSAMAHRAGENAEKSYARGAQVLRGGPLEVREFLPVDACDGEPLFAALSRLSHCAPKMRRALVAATVEAALDDDIINEHEEAFLRAQLAALDCPLPRQIEAA